MIPTEEEGSPFVTSNSAVERPFYVLVEQQLLASGEACLELCEGDIFLVTKYNKVGYWWGVSVYDLDRQGWFPSTFVQPYTGEVPEEATQLFEAIKRNCNQPSEDRNEIHEQQPQVKDIEYNIVTDDLTRFVEYESTMMLSKRGRATQALDSVLPTNQVDDEDEFDYESWADAKNLAKQTNSHSVASKRRKS